LKGFFIFEKNCGVSGKYNRLVSEAIRSGDEKAFGAFLSAEFANVAHFVNQYLRDEMLADDIAQESFISMWINRESINPDLNIRSYIFKIARNKSLNLLREKYYSLSDTIEKREVKIMIDSIQGESVDNKIEALYLEDLINKTYSALPDTIRDSFILSRKFGLTYEEIANAKGLTVKAVEYHIGQALKFFRKRLANYLKLFIGFIL